MDNQERVEEALKIADKYMTGTMPTLAAEIRRLRAVDSIDRASRFSLGDEMIKLRDKIKELEAKCAEKDEALRKSGHSLERLLRWCSQEPSGPSDATETGRWVNQEIHKGLDGLKEALSTDGSRILRQLEAAERLYEATNIFKGVESGDAGNYCIEEDELQAISESRKAYEQARGGE